MFCVRFFLERGDYSMKYIYIDTRASENVLYKVETAGAWNANPLTSYLFYGIIQTRQGEGRSFYLRHFRSKVTAVTNNSNKKKNGHIMYNIMNFYSFIFVRLKTRKKVDYIWFKIE